VKSPGFALVLSQKCIEGYNAAPFSEGYLSQSTAGEFHSGKLSDQKHSLVTVLPWSGGHTGLGTALPSKLPLPARGAEFGATSAA